MKIRTATLFAALMMMLVLVGASYAMWDKWLYIYGTVYTGEVNAEFTKLLCSDTGIDPGYDKDVASCVCELSVDKQTITVTIDNAYPCYSVVISFAITNTGTIPVKVKAFDVIPPGPEVTVKVVGPPVGTQIDKGGSEPGSISVHVNQGPWELSKFTFSVTIHLVQWNEA